MTLISSDKSEASTLEVVNKGDNVTRRVWITSSSELTRICDLLPANEGRQSLISSLLEAYKLYENVILVPRIGRDDLEKYHDSRYLDVLLRKRTQLDQSAEAYNEISSMLLNGTSTCESEDECSTPSDSEGDEFEGNSCENGTLEKLDIQFGLTHDCYPFPFMSQYAKLLASSSIAAANKLSREPAIAINWFGGRHHCTKGKAAGFCYINDIILSIGVLRRSLGKVFYLDLDLHHGDGVEAAYAHSRNVATFSVHRYDVGFYPGTGSLESSRVNRYNIPTSAGLCDESLMFIISQIVVPIITKFQPGAIIIQCGCDGLATDVNKEWNLTIKGFSSAIKTVVDSFPSTSCLLLGGGGYNHTETAKCWTYLTKIISGNAEEWDIIPEHPLLDAYEPDGFQFWTDNNTDRKRIKDGNSSSYLEAVKKTLLSI